MGLLTNRNIIGIGTVIGDLLSSIFARWFNRSPYYSEHDSEEYLRDNINSGSLAQPTTVWDADGTAVIEITESDYPTVDFDKVVFSGVTTDSVGVFLSHTRSGGICTVASSAQKLSNVKMWDVDELELGSELVTNGDFATDTDWTKSGATISGGVATITASGSYNYILQNINWGGKIPIKIVYEVDSNTLDLDILEFKQGVMDDSIVVVPSSVGVHSLYSLTSSTINSFHPHKQSHHLPHTPAHC